MQNYFAESPDIAARASVGVPNDAETGHGPTNDRVHTVVKVARFRRRSASRHAKIRVELIYPFDPPNRTHAFVTSLDTMAARLERYQPRRLPGRQWLARCGVVLLIAGNSPDEDAAGPAVLMMRRAERDGDPWSGHVSFPGGRVDQNDASTRAAALRELREETGISAADMLTPIGRLSDLLTREHGRHRPMVVTPYVYRMPHAVPLEPNPEAASLWWEPLSTLVAREHRRSIIWRVAGLPLRVPSVDVHGATLWGLSLMMVDELIRAADLLRS